MNARLRDVAALVLGLAFAMSAGAAVERGDAPTETITDELASAAYRVFDAADGLPQSTVYALAQDGAGEVYAGTEDGVARFDGLRWAPLVMPRASAPSTISALLVDRDDVLWAADDVFGVLRRDAAGALVAVPFDRGTSVEIAELVLPHDGAGVWASSERGLFRCNEDACRAEAALSGRPVAAMLAGDGPEGPCLWLGIEGEGLFRLDAPDTAQPRLIGPLLSKDDGLPNNSLRALALWHGDLWIGTGRGLARWSGSRLIVYGRASGFPDGVVSALQPGYDSQGQPRMLAAQAPGGVIEIKPDGSWLRLGTRNGLPEDSALSLLDVQATATHPAALWIGSSYSGVLRREPGNWQSMDERAGLPHRAIVGMGQVALPGGRARYWLGTVRGSVVWQDGRWQPWLPEALAGERVFAIEPVGDALWLATGRGLIRWRGDRLDEYNPQNAGLPGLIVLGLYPQRRADGHTRLWFSTRHGLGWFEDGAIHTDDAAGALVDSDWFRVVRETDIGGPNATLWAGGTGGLLFDRGQGWERIARDCLPHPDVMDLRVQPDADGREALWVATRGGIAHIDPRSFACTRFGAAQIDKTVVYQIQFDRRGRLYAFGYDGVRRLRFDPDAPLDPARVTVDHMGMADGLPSLEFNRASLIDARGRIWGGSNGGLAIYDPVVESVGERGADTAAPLRLLAARVLSDGSTLASGMHLAAAQGNLHFDYRLLTARREHRNRYRTQLEGLDAMPGAWTAASSVEYSRVPPGAYTFRVWAQDELGRESGPEEVRFSIAYPLWRQPFALVGYGLLLVGLGMGIGRLRARALAHRADALERQVGARTAELAEANLQLERAALTDPLTGLWNRRHFHDSLPDVLARSPRLALLLIDIDHFKRINDGHGHDAGDAVLREFARRLQAFVQDDELALRWGGEEFLLALPRHDARSAARRAAALLQAIRGTPFVCSDASLALTCSIGWVCLPWPDAATLGLGIDQALMLADTGLYRAKEQGRARAIGVLPGRADDPRPQPQLPPVRFVDDNPVSSLVPFRR